MNVFDVDVKKLGEDLEKEGLSPEEARTKLNEAFGFLVTVRASQLAKKMLPDAIIAKQRDLVTKLATFIGQYRKSGMPGIAAEVYQNAVPAGIDSLTIILTCEELTRLGIIKEWAYIPETRQWREMHRDPDPDKIEQKVFIHKDVINAGVHIFDFRKGKMYNRHFLPGNWHGKEQCKLCQHLAEAAKKAKEAYDAAHGKKTNMQVAIEKAIAEKKVQEVAPAEVVEPVDTAVAVVEQATEIALEAPAIVRTQNDPRAIRFREDIMPDAVRGKGKNKKNRQPRKSPRDETGT